MRSYRSKIISIEGGKNTLLLIAKKIHLGDKARMKFKRKIRELTQRNNPLSIYQVIQELNAYLRGWIAYFRIQEFRYLFRDLDAWIRSR